MSSLPPSPIAVVTGASSGIGASIASRLAQSGFTVFGTSRKPAAPQTRREFEMLALDVTSDDSVAALVDEVIGRVGRIDVLVNNAGFGISPAAAEESSMTQAAGIFDTNLLGLIRTTQAVLPHMRLQGGGRILNISSVLGFLPTPFGALYASSKHAVEGYSESLDHELRLDGIRVSLIQPAYTKTAFFQNALRADDLQARFDDRRDKVEEAIARAEAAADAPEVVAETVLRALHDPSPKVRYPAGKTAARLAVLRRFMPSGIFESVLRKNFGMD